MMTRFGFRRAWTRRALSLLLAAVMALGFLPGFPGAENSGAEAQWAEPYLNQLVEWGFIRPDQVNNPNMALTRADFMAIVNRAYGYSTPGETPFEDVEPNQWFYDDVGIAYNARYIVGTSPTTASPNDPLTRETAATVLGRNMMLQESPGEILEFTDARQISNWAMGTVKSSLEHYLISGYTDGTLRPKRNVSWGEMAAMVTNLVGTPLQEEGDYALGGTFGNVTITSSNVTLRDSAVSGDTYVTGGVGLGNVKMENVDVLGRIIASGTGRSEGGEASILLRNVTADELLIDNLQDNYVSVQVDGISEITRTTVRTSSYIEDNTPDGMGLKYISIEGDVYPDGEEPDDWEPIQVDLAGRIGEVVNRTPKSQVRVGKGTVEKMTVDEAATDSTLIIDRGATVKELNLDTATTVTGEGDIGHLVVNAPGCVIDIMPDEITIRPGITAVICGQEMDSMAAEQFSMEPLILAGYPEARDITPTGLEGVFMTNKAGTVYYAVSAITDGSVGADDLIKPPSYGSIAAAGGSVKVSQGNEEVTAAIGGLTPGGSYYLSAVLEDAKGNRSPVKVISFTTPDNSIPAFAPGYPHMSKVSPKDSVVVTMTTKDCKLYYALLPQGAAAPTEAEMRANAVAGALGFGVRDAYKNVEDVFRVNDQLLDEQTTYVLYFFLMDADGVNKSQIISITFKTDDETPPIFIVEPNVTNVQATSVGLTFRLNEDGTVYWVAIPANTTNYPKPEPGTDYETAPPNSMYGKLQIASGMNIGTDGKFGKVACKAYVDGTITVSGLKPETAYDFYYVAKDNAGPDRNYSEIWKKITIYTLDTTGPKFFQSFSDASSPDGKSKPLASTDIYLDVSENVRYTGANGGTSFLELYQAVKDARTEVEKNAAKEKLAESLYGAIKLYKVDAASNNVTKEVPSKKQTSATSDNWVIDYTQARVEAHEGGIRITFPNSGLNLENGGKYYFVISDVTDISNNQNPLVPSIVNFHDEDKKNASIAGGHDVPEFTVESAWVNFSTPGVGAGNAPVRRNTTGTGAQFVRMDMTFRLTPMSTGTVSSDICYDLMLWTRNVAEFDLYYRVVNPDGQKILDENGQYPMTYTATDPTTDRAISASNYLLPRLSGRDNTPDVNGWIYLGNSGLMLPSGVGDDQIPYGISVNRLLNGCDDNSFPPLNTMCSDLRYEFVIHLTQLNGVDEYDASGAETWRYWDEDVAFEANVISGISNDLYDTPDYNGMERIRNETNEDSLTTIGRNSTGKLPIDTQVLTRSFSDSRLPRFDTGKPTFEPGSHSVTVNVSFNNNAWLYYVVGKADDGSADHIPEIRTIRTLLTDLTDANGSPYYTEAVEGNATIAGNIENGDLKIVDGTPGKTTVRVRMTDMSSNGTMRLMPPEDGTVLPAWMVGGVKEGVTDTNSDDPEAENLITIPNNLFVYQPTAPGSTVPSTAKNGSAHFAGGALDTLEIDELEPETDYFAYFVLKGETSSTLSHVYIYHFRTTEAEKPKIDADADSEGAVINVEAKNDSRVRYYTYSRTDVEKLGSASWLNDYIYVSEEYFNRTGSKDRVEPTPVEREDGIFYKMTVMKAIVTTYFNEDSAHPNEDGYSVFDVYADNDMKTKVGGYLRNGTNLSGLTPVKGGDGQALLKFDENTFEQEITVHPGTLEPGTEYVLIAVAWDANAGTNDFSRMSFGGEMPIPAAESGAPRAQRLTGELYGTIKEEDADTTGYDGEIEILFNKNVYIYNSGDSLTASKDAANLAENFLSTATLSADLRNRIKSGAVTVTVTDDPTRITLTGKFKVGDTIRLYGSQIQSSSKERNTQSELLVRVEKTTMNGKNGVRIYMLWEDLGIPANRVEEPNYFYEFAEAKEITVNLSPESLDTSVSFAQDDETSWMMIVSSVLPKKVKVVARVTNITNPTYSWTPTTGLIAVTEGANASTATITCDVGATLNNITVKVTGTDSLGNPVEKTAKLTVSVNAITPTSITKTVGTLKNGAITWDLSKNAATITLDAKTALPTTLNVATQTKVTSDAIKLTSASVDSTRKKVTLQVALGGNIPADKEDTLEVKIGSMTCTIPVTYTGSQSSQSGANISGTRPY